jgi:DNA repair exonuclease SbcCD ATPase subunit/DNA repair exonuclease SbcCD nuclease subunit
MYKIAHIADTHIRNLKYHDEYRIAFRDLYEKLANDSPDCIVHCGDLAHTKTQLSPEYFQLCAEFLASLANIAPTYVILGNHDGNLKNDNRQDAVTPIVNALRHPNLHLLKDSGETIIKGGLVLNVLSVFDRDNWIKPTDESKINVALYHGAIAGSMTGANWAMDQGDDNVDIFRDFDFAMLGDIHRQQQLDHEGRVWYCGSTIQQKFSESALKGYLLWEITNKNKFNVVKRFISNPRPFITVRLENDGTLPDVHVQRGARLRIVSKTNLPSDKLRKARSIADMRWSPYSITVLNGKESASMHDEGAYANAVLTENLRDISVQEKYIKDYLSDMELEPSVIEKVLEHNKKYNTLAEQGEEVSRNVIWKIKKAEWDNLFNYGEKNQVDFTKLNGLVGIFGRNYSGKSSIIDSILFTLFNATSKGERKNVHVINQNKNKAIGKIEIEIGDKTYKICRNLEKYTKKYKGKETQEAKVDLDFHLISDDESLNGTSRVETDANIKKRFGSMEDFLLTSMASQLDSLSFVKEGTTKRKEILAKFLDLQIFDKKYKLAKKDAAELRGVVKRLQDKKWDSEIQKNVEILEEIEEELIAQRAKCEKITLERSTIQSELDILNSRIENIPAESIDIDKIINQIAQTQKRKSHLKDKTQDFNFKVWELEESLDSKSKEFDTINIGELRLTKASADAFEHKIKEARKALDFLISIEKTERKKIKMLDNHQYDPDCSFCCDNKFVKDAHNAKTSLPITLEKIAHLQQHQRDLQDSLNSLNISETDKQIDLHVKLQEEIHRIKRTIEMNKLSIEGNKSKINLLAKEYEELCEKKRLYDENKEAIENLETLKREQAALLSVVENKDTLFKKCQDRITKILVEQGSTQTTLGSLKESRKELEEVEREWIAYDLFQQCMHANGIPYQIIKQKLPLLNEEIAKILGNIVDFEVFFESNDAKLDILIKHPFYDSRPLSMGSGAEKTIASMAIRLALISITNLPKSELFILDEPATALDQEHMEGFTRLLSLIKNQFKTVILISHLDSLKDVVDMTIDINKVDGYASVRI